MIKLSISALQEVAISRPPEYLADILAAGNVAGDTLWLSKEDYKRLCAQYRPKTAPPESPLAQHRQEICRLCPESSDHSFTCRLYKGCCFGSWRTQPSSQCPAHPPKWPSISPS